MRRRRENALLLALHDLLAVELEFGAFENVSFSNAVLSGTRGNGGKKTTGQELFLDGGLEFGKLLALNLKSLFFLSLGSGLSGVVIRTLLSNIKTVEFFVPLAERSGVDLNDAVLDEGVGADELVVGGVVNDVQKTGLLLDSCGRQSKRGGKRQKRGQCWTKGAQRKRSGGGVDQQGEREREKERETNPQKSRRRNQCRDEGLAS